MIAKLESITDLLQRWKSGLDDLGYHLQPEKEVLEIKVDNNQLKEHLQIEEVIDWWPKSEIERRAERLNKFGTYGADWQTNKGTLQTADYLLENKGQVDHWGAIFIQAFIKETLADRGKWWKGEVEPLFEIKDLFSQHGEWHYTWNYATKRALPVSSLSGRLASTVTMENSSDFLRFAALDTVLNLSAWQLVRVIGIAS